MDHNTFTLRENIHQLPSVLVTKVFLGVALQVHLGGRVSKWRKRGELSCSWLDGLLLGPTGLCHDLLLLCVGGDSDLLVPAFLLRYVHTNLLGDLERFSVALFLLVQPSVLHSLSTTSK